MTLDLSLVWALRRPKLAEEISDENLELFKRATHASHLEEIRSAIHEYVSGGEMSGETLYRLLEASTPLLALNCLPRSGVRNRLPSGLQQTYADHNRLLLVGIDHLLSGNNSWFLQRTHPSESGLWHDLENCKSLLDRAALSREETAGLWISGSLHDIGKVLGRGFGLDAEDACYLAKPLVSAVGLDHMLGPIMVAIRNHDLVERVDTGETPAEFILEELRSLNPRERYLALLYLGIIQLAGAASLGRGRVSRRKVGICVRCITDSLIPPRHDRLSLLLDSAGEVGDVLDEVFVQRVVLQGWKKVTEGMHLTVVRSMLKAIVREWSVRYRDHRHVVMDTSIRDQILEGERKGVDLSNIIGPLTFSLRLLNGERAMIISAKCQEYE
jgi:hypothetical protein